MDTRGAKSGCMHACLYSGMKVCVYLRVCVLHISQNFIIFSRMQYRYINLLSAWKRYIHLYFYLCMYKIPHSFDHWHCIVFRLYVKLLTSILCNHQKITVRRVTDLYLSRVPKTVFETCFRFSISRLISMATGSIMMKMSIFQKIRGPSEKYPFLFLLCQFKLLLNN